MRPRCLVRAFTRACKSYIFVYKNTKLTASSPHLLYTNHTTIRICKGRAKKDFFCSPLYTSRPMTSQNSFKIVTAAEMREIEARAFREFGLSSLILMEHAGTSIADIAERNFLSSVQRRETPRVLVLCGKGNNGGDGFVAARHLANRGHEIDIYLAGAPQDLKGDALVNCQIAQKMGLSMTPDAQNKLSQFEYALQESDLVIDALFGTGLERPVEEPLLSLITTVNRVGKPVLSADIPSGLHSDTGQMLPTAIQAKATAVLGLPKQGLYVANGPAVAGQIYLVDIGLPKILLPAN